jgi:peptidoglycan/xylan/chitin deacetylase (PgdA/CDA1 family)
MIDFIFTTDYEIYGNGEGSLKNHIFEPTRKLKKIFDQTGAKLVFFVEAAELERIEAAKSDPAIADVKNQIKDLYNKGHEIALHLHPQWYNGTYKNGKWVLDNSEYNLCVLPEKRIIEIIDRSINYLRSVLSDPDYTPLSFRAGNWLFQPTQPAAKILSSRGIKIDSSVFKGGLQHRTRLDYRPALNNGYFWTFKEDVNILVSSGELLEIPIYSVMVPPWRMATKKRLGLQQKSTTGRKTLTDKINRVLDFARPLQPLKLDFCRMTIDEIKSMMESIIKDDQKTPTVYKPISAIGHTKDLIDFETVDSFLFYLNQNNITISTFQDVYSILMNPLNNHQRKDHQS